MNREAFTREQYAHLYFKNQSLISQHMSTRVLWDKVIRFVQISCQKKWFWFLSDWKMLQKRLNSTNHQLDQEEMTEIQNHCYPLQKRSIKITPRTRCVITWHVKEDPRATSEKLKGISSFECSCSLVHSQHNAEQQWCACATKRKYCI